MMIRERYDCRLLIYVPLTMAEAVEAFAAANAVSVSSVIRMLIANHIPGAGGVPANGQHQQAAE